MMCRSVRGLQGQGMPRTRCAHNTVMILSCKLGLRLAIVIDAPSYGAYSTVRVLDLRPKPQHQQLKLEWMLKGGLGLGVVGRFRVQEPWI